MLIFATDKKKYNVGETIHLTFPSSGVGRALVSVENGSRVMQTHWVEAGEKETRFSIKTTDKMAPNVYLNVTLVQPHAQTANSLPIRLYGVVPVEIVNPATHLQPTIDMPDVLAPEKPVTIKVKEKQGRKMTYTLAVVDEGLLDLTRFKTPDPWQSFYAREALGVKTWDMYDDVIGASGGDVERLLSIGGDESAVRKAGTKANRFKPVVKFLGPFELNPGATGEHTFTMPRYVGSVKTMIIGGDHKAYGHAEKTTPVRTPLMVLATLPRVIGPGETVKLPVSVFAMENEVKKVSVQIQTNPLFTAPDGTRKSITFHQPGDEILEFDLKTVSAIGTGKVTVIAKSGKHQAQYDIEMDVRTPNPRITTVKDGLVKAGQKLDLTFLPPGIDGTNKIAIEVSSLPAMDIQKRLSYLLQYPHGCIEQTTSSVFPQLFVGDVIEVDPATQTKMDNHVKAGLRRLRLFQLPNGGFSYWPGNDKASNWGSTYAGHFMLEAERKGYTLPMGMKNNWIRYQKNTARNWRKQKRHSDSYYRLSDLDQAYRLYTLALANSVDLGAMNRLKEYTDLSPQARFRLGAAYQMAGRPEVAEQLLDGVTTSIAPYKETGRNFGSFTRDLAMIIEALSICEKREKAAPLVKILSENMRSKRWMSTQTTAYALIAATQFVGTDNGNKTIHFNYASDGATAKNKQSRKPVVCVDIERTSASAGQMVIDNKGQTLLYVRIISTGVPAAGQETTAQDRLEMEVVYLNLQGKAIDPSALDQGTDFMARVTVKNPGLGNHYQAMALTQVFPSGWEIRNLRLDGTGAAWAEDQPDYMDIRDDRVMQYFDLRRGKSKTFVVLLNAAYQGKFYLPAVSCEAMYDRTIFAHQAGRWVKVVKPGADGL